MGINELAGREKNVYFIIITFCIFVATLVVISEKPLIFISNAFENPKEIILFYDYNISTAPELTTTNPEVKQELELSENAQKVVIIVSFMRSGSSFLGEIFNNHKDAFYMYEPLHHHYDATGSNCIGEDTLDVAKRLDDLIKLSKCQFEDRYDVSSSSWKEAWDEFSETILLKNHLDYRGNFPFRYKNRRLCLPPFCEWPNGTAHFEKCNFACPPVKTEMAIEVCNSVIPVIKTVRYCELLRLEIAFKANNIEPRIIFLARDPRGQLQSRISLFSSEFYKTNYNKTIEPELSKIKQICKGSNKILDMIESSPWLKHRSITVRYEDLALEPLFIVEKVLNHSGLEFSTEVREWVRSNTQRKRRALDPFGTDRSAKTWKGSDITAIPKDDLNDLEKYCEDEMKRLNYS